MIRFNSSFIRKSILLLCLVASVGIAVAQSPKREMRSAWMATVSRIDWPNAAITPNNTTSINNQKTAMTNILDSLAANNMNAVFFQVRPMCDAMYDSPYEPWSSFLTGTRGTAPGGGFDPLQYIVEEGHKRGIEVHVWLNPYRFETSRDQWKGRPGDYRDILPEGCLLTYSSGRSILNPGRPEVRDRIKLIIGDIVSRYDVDGVIFDDYFYEDSTGALDDETFRNPLYNPDGLGDKNAWRRQNVNKLMAAVADTIQKTKPYVRFGMGPFGIWSTSTAAAASNGLTLPRNITGNGEYYNSKGCDAVAWLSQGSIDYISPQLYWPSSQWPSTPTPPATSAYVAGQAYESLCQWWSDVAKRFGRHFYSSQIGASSPRYMDQIEIGRQIGMNREYNLNGAPGSVLFALKTMMNRSGFFPSLKANYYTQKSLPPAIDWKSDAHYTATIRGSRSGTAVNWDAYSGVPGGARYTVYAVPDAQSGQSGICSTSQHLLGMSYINSFTLPSTAYNSGYTFIIGILDRYGNEFIDGQKMSGVAPATPMRITSPVNGHSYASGTSSVTVVWDIRLAATGFTVQRSANPAFPAGETVTATAGPHTAQFQKTQQTALTGLTNGTYYVRVKADYNSAANSIFYSSDWSEPVQFTIGTPEPPAVPAITSPVNGATVSNPVTVTWYPDSRATRGFTVERSTDSSFPAGSATVSENVGAGTNQFTLPTLADGINYVRVRANYGTSDNTSWSGVVNFTVKDEVVIPPVLTLEFSSVADLPYTIVEPVVEVGGDIYLAIYDGSDYISRLLFDLTSSDTDVATINQYGAIKGLSKGTTIIKAVRKTDSEQEGTVTLVVSTGNVDITVPNEDAISVSNTENGIIVRFNGEADIELYSITGVLIDKTKAYQSYSRDLNGGVYILRINGKAIKLVK